MFPCRPDHRPLFALRPPAALAGLIARDTAWLGPARRVRTDLLHVTLSVLDDWPAEPSRLLAEMRSIGDEIRFPPFRVVLDELRGGPRTVLLRPTETLAALCDFQHQLARRLARAGIATRAGYRFSPHLTLCHGGRPDLVEPADVSWQAEEFLLVESLVGWTEHRVRGRWRLG